MRQMMAVVTQRDRTKQLAAVRVPTLVMHGLSDRMVHVSGGRATAAAIPGAELVLINGWGHDLPVELFETFARNIRRNADRAR
jgi:pimeloyl-ACP methyl ester carboxylesterase